MMTSRALLPASFCDRGSMVSEPLIFCACAATAAVAITIAVKIIFFIFFYSIDFYVTKLRVCDYIPHKEILQFGYGFSEFVLQAQG